MCAWFDPNKLTPAEEFTNILLKVNRDGSQGVAGCRSHRTQW
ncbi:Multidrug efflux system, inner membrane proton/drug antiporter (RND type) =_ MexB of MexAB-OprM [Kosakonia radicincitans]|nr:Multidrug efflux system, inner membrane proton/drug antiporter (RND type) => MexB of MexAB-OprM [Kosakonia radicincitans]